MRRILLYLTCVLTLNAQTRVDLKSQAKSVDFTEAQSTRPIKTGVALPATCVTGDMYLMTSAPAGRNLYACTATNLWSMQAPPELPEMTEQANKVLVHDGTGLSWQRVGGDVTGNIGALSVTRLRGNPVSSISPSEGQALVWDAIAGEWVPRGIEGGSGQALYCSASGTSSAYSCVMNPQLTTYTIGMTIHFRAHTASGAGATLDIDGLGSKMLLRSDGSAPAAGEFLSGGHYLLLYDGTAFRASGMPPAPPVNTSLDGMVPTRSSNTVLSVSGGGWRRGGLMGVNTFAGGDITVASGSGDILWCLGTDQVYVGATASLVLSAVPAGTTQLDNPVASCDDHSTGAIIEWWRWPVSTGVVEASQGSGNDKRYTAATPEPCASTTTVTATRDPLTGACAYTTAPYDIFDRSRVWFVDDFGFGNNASPNIGTLQWNITNASGVSTTNNAPSEGNHPGVSYISSGGADDNGGCISANSLSSNAFLDTFTADGNSALEWIFKTPSDLTNLRIALGYLNLGIAFGTGSGLGSTINTRVTVEYDQSDADTVFRFRQCNGASCTTGDSTVTVAADTWYRARIASSSAGTFSYSIDGETAVDLTGTMPAFDASPAACVWTNTAAQRTLKVDRVAFLMTGLAR